MVVRCRMSHGGVVPDEVMSHGGAVPGESWWKDNPHSPPYPPPPQGCVSNQVIVIGTALLSPPPLTP